MERAYGRGLNDYTLQDLQPPCAPLDPAPPRDVWNVAERIDEPAQPVMDKRVKSVLVCVCARACMSVASNGEIGAEDTELPSKDSPTMTQLQEGFNAVESKPKILKEHEV